MEARTLKTAVDNLKALGHPARLRMLALLKDGELCVCQVTEVLGLAPSTVSEHLSILRRAGFIEERKEGRWVYYAPAGHPGLQAICASLWRVLDQDATLSADAAKCATLRGLPPSAEYRSGERLNDPS